MTLSRRWWRQMWTAVLGIMAVFASTTMAPFARAGDGEELYVVGIYSGGAAHVHVAVQGAPVVLTLCGYHTKHWNVTLAEGVQLKKVILSGLHPQHVNGIPEGVPVIDQNETTKERYKFYATAKGTYDYGKLLDSLRRLTGLDVTSFQGHSSRSEKIIVQRPQSAQIRPVELETIFAESRRVIEKQVEWKESPIHDLLSQFLDNYRLVTKRGSWAFPDGFRTREARLPEKDTLAGESDRVFLTEGSLALSNANNCLIIAGGEVKISHGVGNVVIAGHVIDVSHDGSRSSSPETSGSLLVSGSAIRVGHARGTICSSPGVVAIGGAEQVTLVNSAARIGYSTGEPVTIIDRRLQISTTLLEDLFRDVFVPLSLDKIFEGDSLEMKLVGSGEQITLKRGQRLTLAGVPYVDEGWELRFAAQGPQRAFILFSKGKQYASWGTLFKPLEVVRLKEVEPAPVPLIHYGVTFVDGEPDTEQWKHASIERQLEPLAAGEVVPRAPQPSRIMPPGYGAVAILSEDLANEKIDSFRLKLTARPSDEFPFQGEVEVMIPRNSVRDKPPSIRLALARAPRGLRFRIVNADRLPLPERSLVLSRRLAPEADEKMDAIQRGTTNDHGEVMFQVVEGRAYQIRQDVEDLHPDRIRTMDFHATHEVLTAMQPLEIYTDRVAKIVSAYLKDEAGNQRLFNDAHAKLVLDPGAREAMFENGRAFFFDLAPGKYTIRIVDGNDAIQARVLVFGQEMTIDDDTREHKLQFESRPAAVEPPRGQSQNRSLPWAGILFGIALLYVGAKLWQRVRT